MDSIIKSITDLNGCKFDLAGEEHWNSIWAREREKRFDLRSYYDYRLSQLFNKFIASGSRILEVGCGGSAWLPYFAKHLKCEVWGIDYSEPGVALASRNLKIENVSGTVVLGDVFETKDIPECYFDVVWTGGFVEHFDDISVVIRKLATFLKPKGTIITLVPNLDGFIGALHKTVDRKIYDTHSKIDPKMLDEFHLNADLEVILGADYFGVFSIGVVNFNRFRSRLPRVCNNLFWLGMVLLQQGICLPFRILRFHRESRLFSPWILGIYRLCKECDPS